MLINDSYIIYYTKILTVQIKRIFVRFTIRPFADLVCNDMSANIINVHDANVANK